ncbi:hypothetical protein [Demequina maris]|uniref:hypothetical protein n=1 Tax=Demequina maris TaxID=1638982 RepID=UPI000782131C|nr:hypothetical protein [Demequina maris]
MRQVLSFVGIFAATVASTGVSPVPADDGIDLTEVPVQVPAGALIELTEAGESADTELMLTGDINSISDGEIDADTAQVVAQAWPAGEVLQSQSEGTQFTLLPIALSDVNNDGTFELAADPEEIPEGYIGDDGIVDLLVTAWDGDTVAETSTSVAFDEVTDGFVDPLAVEILGEARSSDDEDYSSDVVRELGDAPEVDLADAQVSDQQSVDMSLLEKPWTSCTTTVLERGIIRNAVIGESLPTSSGQTSWLSFKNSQSVSTGVAVSSTGNAGTFSISGTTTNSGSFSQTWSASASKRYYRVGVEVGRYKSVCTGTVSGATSSPVTTYSTRVIGLTGGTSSIATSLTPSWSYCDSIDAGTWTRSSSTANAYSNSLGLTLPAPASISVTSKSQYSSSHTLYFKQSTSKTMCGNNAYPGSAGRIRGKG